MATLGIDFGVTKVKTGKSKVKVNIFDLAGHSFFAEVSQFRANYVCSVSVGVLSES